MNLRPFLLISLIANCFFAVLKFTAAVFTGSIAMVSEGIHSVIDLINQVLLLLGLRSNEKSPDFSRPFGYSKELYFWSSIASLTIFIIGGCVSIYNGINRFNQPYAEVHQTWSYDILGAALVFNVFAVIFSIKKLNRPNDGLSILDTAELNGNPSILVILLSAMGDLCGILVVWAGMYLGHQYQSAYYDSAAAIIIGFILFSTSFFLIRQCKRQLMTDIISPTTLRKIVELARTDNAVMDVTKHFTMYLAPKEALLVLEAVFKNDLNNEQVNDSINRLSTTIKKRFPRVKMVYIDKTAA